MEENNRQAVVIGINNYKDPDIPKLSGAVNDASEIRQRLIEFGKFQITDEHFLTDAKASSQSIRKSISDVLWRADPCDLVLFYFSGHGFQDGYGNGYIAPHDMIMSEPFVCGIDMLELRQMVLRSQNKQCILVLLDCCYSGIPTVGERAVPEAVTSFDPYFADLSGSEGGEGKIIIASSGEDQKSREVEVTLGGSKDLRFHGNFTYHMLEGLDGEAADDSGTITLERLYKYIEDQLTKKGKQKPMFYAAGASQLGRIMLATSPHKLEDFIKSAIERARQNIEQNTFLNISIAATDVNQVLEKNKDNGDAIILRGEIEGKLSDYQKITGDWLYDNELQTRPKIQSAYLEYYRSVRNLNFDKIIKLDQRGIQLLSTLCDISTGIIEYDTFIDKSRRFDNPVNTSTQSSRAS